MGNVNAFNVCVRIETITPKSVDIMKFPEDSNMEILFSLLFWQDIMKFYILKKVIIIFKKKIYFIKFIVLILSLKFILSENNHKISINK